MSDSILAQSLGMDESFIPVSIGLAVRRDLATNNNLNYNGQLIEYDDSRTVVSKKGPFVKTKWHQDYPFNGKLGGNCKWAGCTPIAVAQILAHNEFGGTGKYNWKLLKTIQPYSDLDELSTPQAQDMAGWLIKDIASPKNVSVACFGDQGTLGWANGVVRTFESAGYKNIKKHSGKYDSESSTLVFSQLEKNYPVFILAGDGFSGHSWVIDGYLITKKYKNNKLISTEKLLHCNFGWNSAADGYYADGVFNLNERVTYEEEFDSGTTVTPNSHWTWHFRIVTYDF